jgi:soluble cytochrome b562
MKPRLVISSLVVAAAAAVAAFAFAAQEAKPDPNPPPPQAGADRKKRHEGEDTPLAQQMERIDHAMHKLKRGVRDATQKDACLTEVANAQQACLAAKLLTPKMTATLPEAERADFVRDFRKGVAALLVEFANLEIALLDGDAEKSVATYKKLEAMEDEGHNRFTNE